MNVILRAAIVYFVLLILFRIAGKRSFQQITTFDFVLLLIVSEATQQALVGDDPSITAAFLVVATFIVIDIGLSLVKERAPRLEKWMEGVPTVIVEHGRPLKDRMLKVRVDENDVLAAARESQGLERMEQIKFAVLERGGAISIIPAREPAA